MAIQTGTWVEWDRAHYSHEDYDFGQVVGRNEARQWAVRWELAGTTYNEDERDLMPINYARAHRVRDLLDRVLATEGKG